MSERKLWLQCGIAGMVGLTCYLLAISIPWPDNQFGLAGSLLVVSAWPILSVFYAYGLCRFIAAEADGLANRVAFVLATAGFVTVLAMIIVQNAVGAGIAEMAAGLDEVTARALRRGLRLIDLGLDVAWDLLIGTALVLWGFAARRRRGLGPLWAIPSAGFGVALIGLNLATFPTPPGAAGLFDLGPFIALFMFLLAGRLVLLARHPAGPVVERAGERPAELADEPADEPAPLS